MAGLWAGRAPGSGLSTPSESQASGLAAAVKWLGGHGELPAPPDAVEAILRREDARLNAITWHILDAGPLRWEQDVTKGWAAPMPGFLGQRQLQSLLLARAWTADRDGKPDAAERALEASWRLNAASLARADLVSHILGVGVARMQHSVLRVMRRPAPEWLSRMGERPFASGFSTAVQLEAWGWLVLPKGFWNASDLIRDRGVSGQPATSSLAVRLLATPYSQLALAGTLDTLRKTRSELASQRRCDFDLDAFGKRLDKGIPRWNGLARLGTPSLVRAWLSQREADLDRELTQRVLSARAERAALGRWPTADVPSAVCEGVFWQHRPAADGGLTIQAGVRPFAIDDKGATWSAVARPPGD